LGKIFTERFGSGSNRNQRSPAVTLCGERELYGRKKKRGQRKSPDRTDIDTRVPYCVTRVSWRLVSFLSM
jgi:hypothetical protein